MKKLISLLVALVLTLCAASAFAAEYNDKETVTAVQQALNDAGYDCGVADGIAGKNTRAAVTGFQTDHGLEATGVIDDALLAALGLAEAPAEPAQADEPEATAEPAEAPAPVETATPAPLIVPVEDGAHTFMGVPWGSTQEECLSILYANNFPLSLAVCDTDDAPYYYPENSADTTDLYYTYVNSFYYYDQDQASLSYDMKHKMTCTGIGESLLYEGYQLQSVPGLDSWYGYPIFSLELHFLKGTATSDAARPGLSMVKVLYANQDEGRFDALTKSMVDTYGEYTEDQLANGAILRTWTGEENTIVGLMNRQDTLCSLVYAKTDDYLTVNAQ